ncbi:hypothetical protein Tco_1294067 [Tanacetum coccineum]
MKTSKGTTTQQQNQRKEAANDFIVAAQLRVSYAGNYMCNRCRHIISQAESLLVSHSLWSSQSFGHQKAINGFDMPLPVARFAQASHPLAPSKGKYPW